MPSLLLPYYHLVSDEPGAHVRHLYPCRSVSAFKRDIDYFLSRHTPIGLADLAALVREGRPLPERAFLPSFDDGFREMHDVVAPILAAKGVRGAFFLNTSTLDNRELCLHQKISLILEERARRGPEFPIGEAREILAADGISGADFASALKSIPWSARAAVDRIAALGGLDCAACLRDARPYLTSDEVKRMMAMGMEIGAHSIDHPRYSEIGLEEQIRQTESSMEALAERFAQPVRAFAFPHSDSGASPAFFRHIFERSGIEVTFGTRGMVPDSQPGHFQRFSMEKVPGPPGRIVLHYRARACLRRLRGRGPVQHA